MQIPGSLQAAGATVITRTIGAAARLLDHRNKPQELQPLLRRESLLMAATGVLTYAVHELFDRVIIPEVSKSSLLVRNQTLWRAVLSVPGLLVIEWLSRRFFSDKKGANNAKPGVSAAAEPGQYERKFAQFVQKAKRQREVLSQVVVNQIEATSSGGPDGAKAKVPALDGSKSGGPQFGFSQAGFSQLA